jgi:hypothetical protein
MAIPWRVSASPILNSFVRLISGLFVSPTMLERQITTLEYRIGTDSASSDNALARSLPTKQKQA